MGLGARARGGGEHDEQPAAAPPRPRRGRARRRRPARAPRRGPGPSGSTCGSGWRSSSSGVVLHVLVGLKFGSASLVLPLPEVTLPSWAAGIQLGGDVYLEGLLGAAALGLRLAVIIACIGAANALANPKRLLRSAAERPARGRGGRRRVDLRRTPARRVRAAGAPGPPPPRRRAPRSPRGAGDRPPGPRGHPRALAPARRRDGLARVRAQRHGAARAAPHHRRRDPHSACSLAAVGLYGVLDATTPALMGTPALVAGLALSAVGLWLGGRHVRTSTYRPDPWRGAEWLTVACGLVPAAVLHRLARSTPDALAMPSAAARRARAAAARGGRPARRGAPGVPHPRAAAAGLPRGRARRPGGDARG